MIRFYVCKSPRNGLKLATWHLQFAQIGNLSCCLPEALDCKIVCFNILQRTSIFYSHPQQAYCRP